MCDIHGLAGWSDERLIREFDVQSELLRMREWHLQDAEEALMQSFANGGERYEELLQELGEVVEGKFLTSQLHQGILREFLARIDSALQDEIDDWYGREDRW